jgi:hypothetical protein
MAGTRGRRRGGGVRIIRTVVHILLASTTTASAAASAENASATAAVAAASGRVAATALLLRVVLPYLLAGVQGDSLPTGSEAKLRSLFRGPLRGETLVLGLLAGASQGALAVERPQSAALTLPGAVDRRHDRDAGTRGAGFLLEEQPPLLQAGR